MIEGGIKRPSVAEPARVPITTFSGYPRRASSGIDSLPMVAAVAAEEPETAAKIPQAKIFTCSSWPGRRFIHGARPVNMSSDRRERNRISPIQMNKGNAASAQELLWPHIVVAITSPKGASVNRAMAATPTPSRAKATQRPAPRKRNRRKRRTMESAATDIGKSYSLRRFSPLPCQLGSAPRRTQISSSASAIVRIMRPNATGSCGIQSGTDTIPELRSPNSWDSRTSSPMYQLA
mmetsp:Transcript_13169/g.17350  ORF Transcript_13169/g.17350 Transcript_13169/m.17350 type:complete len:235 (+) Transcript_13169:76-780(+)